MSFPQAEEELKALKKTVQELQEGQAKLQKEIEALKATLRESRTRQATEPSEVVLSLKDDPVKGDKNATLTLIEFSDYQCPFCARYARETFPEIEREYIRTGKVKYVFRDLPPIASLHPQAFKAHEAAKCAGEQGKYWEMHDQLFTHELCNEAWRKPEKPLEKIEEMRQSLVFPYFQERRRRCRTLIALTLAPESSSAQALRTKSATPAGSRKWLFFLKPGCNPAL